MGLSGFFGAVWRAGCRCVVAASVCGGARGLFGLAALAGVFAGPTAHAACAGVLGQSGSSQGLVRLQDATPQSLCQYSGRVVLVVNTASYCGFTGQYEGLEALHEKYKDRGLVVLGFPSNDYGNQEPGDSKAIADFCRLTYGVKFPMFGKITIAPPNTHPFFESLAQATGSRPRWNFHKYLIDRSGQKVLSFSSFTRPESASMTRAIETFLKADR